MTHRPSEGGSAPSIVISAGGGLAFPNVHEVWNHRELIYFLMRRDIRVRYTQTVLGGLWALIQPLVLTVVFTVVFSRIAGVSSRGVPYPLFAMCALIPWTLFSQALSTSSASLVSNSGLISKVYFPRLAVPISSAFSFLLDFAIGLVLLFFMMIYFGVWPRAQIVLVPLFAIMTLAAALAGGIWLSALNVKYRDVRYAVPFALQVLLFVSPLGYSSVELGGIARILYGLNPMAGIAEGFRWAMLGADTEPFPIVIVSGLTIIVMLVASLLYFGTSDRRFADLL